jgi:hypothetical protein
MHWSQVMLDLAKHWFQVQMALCNALDPCFNGMVLQSNIIPSVKGTLHHNDFKVLMAHCKTMIPISVDGILQHDRWSQVKGTFQHDGLKC